MCWLSAVVNQGWWERSGELAFPRAGTSFWQGKGIIGRSLVVWANGDEAWDGGFPSINQKCLRIK